MLVPPGVQQVDFRLLLGAQVAVHLGVVLMQPAREEVRAGEAVDFVPQKPLVLGGALLRPEHPPQKVVHQKGVVRRAGHLLPGEARGETPVQPGKIRAHRQVLQHGEQTLFGLLQALPLLPHPPQAHAQVIFRRGRVFQQRTDGRQGEPRLPQKPQEDQALPVLGGEVVVTVAFIRFRAQQPLLDIKMNGAPGDARFFGKGLNPHRKVPLFLCKTVHGSVHF